MTDKVFIAPAAVDARLGNAIREYMEKNERSCSWLLTRALLESAGKIIPPYTPPHPMTERIPTAYVSAETFAHLQAWAESNNVSLSAVERNLIAFYLKIQSEQEQELVTIDEKQA